MSNYLEIFEQQAITYSQYRTLVDDLLKEGKITGDDHSNDMVQYSKMNVQRMNRLDKTVNLSDDLIATVSALKTSYKLLVITEGWCGDAAQIVPIINKIVAIAPNKLALRFVLRDQNLPLIDTHLTNGGRAIPVLLILDEQGNLVLPKWGPRPAVLQSLMMQWKQEGVVMPELAEQLHTWYAKDKTATTQGELSNLFKQLS